jgi:hypothetical protein
MIDEQQGQEGREEVYAHQRSVVYGIWREIKTMYRCTTYIWKSNFIETA